MKIYGRRESMISLQHKGKALFLSFSLSSFNHFYSDKGNPEVPSLQLKKDISVEPKLEFMSV